MSIYMKDIDSVQCTTCTTFLQIQNNFKGCLEYSLPGNKSSEK